MDQKLEVRNMEEKEMNVKELFKLINNYDGDFFVRVVLEEEGDIRGQKARRSVYTTGKRTTAHER